METFDGRVIAHHHWARWCGPGPAGTTLAILPGLGDSIGHRYPPSLEGDPRYLIGRLQQALTVDLGQDLPPMDAQTALLSQALGVTLNCLSTKVGLVLPVTSLVKSSEPARAPPTGCKRIATTRPAR